MAFASRSCSRGSRGLVIATATATASVMAMFVACSDNSADVPTLRNGTSSSSSSGDGGNSSSGSSGSSGSDNTTSSGAPPPDNTKDATVGVPAPDADTTPLSPDETGEATYYDADGTGACGFPASTDFLVCAINGTEYSTANCGRCVAVTGPNGTSVTVRIVDKCPGCAKGGLDLSETAFSKIADKSAGRVNITWHFVTCP